MTDNRELNFEFALPNDPALDEFESGVTEVDDNFRSRKWFHDGTGKASPPTYKFWAPHITMRKLYSSGGS